MNKLVVGNLQHLPQPMACMIGTRNYNNGRK
jgi:hypothetical protein